MQSLLLLLRTGHRVDVIAKNVMLNKKQPGDVKRVQPSKLESGILCGILRWLVRTRTNICIGKNKD